jgi:hypothetical protein
MVLKHGHFGKHLGKIAWGVLKCGAGESWRRLVRPIERHTKKDKKESRRKETFFRQ